MDHIGTCMICLEEKEVRYIDLYIIGSEGLNICHPCEMELVEFARSQRNKNARRRLEAQKQAHIKLHPIHKGAQTT